MGVTNANSTFQIRPRDLAKFGSLYLNGGTWKGHPVVPQDWIEASFARNGLIRGQGYGLLWWKTVFVVRDAEREVLYASGNGGNLVFVVPSERLVVVINASNYNGPGPSYSFMRDDILRAIR
jgi:CubicO group peptidase (beta-lactamase class C family)